MPEVHHLLDKLWAVNVDKVLASQALKEGKKCEIFDKCRKVTNFEIVLTKFLEL